MNPLMLSVFPDASQTKAYNPKHGVWEGIPYRNFSRVQYRSNRVFRLLQRLRGQLAAAGWCLTNFRKLSCAYFYNPRCVDSMLHLRLLRWLKVPIAVDQTELFSSKKSKWSRKEERWVARYSDVLFLISDRLMKHFEGKTRGKLFKLPIMVDFERFQHLPDALHQHIGYIGSFAGKDGIDGILEAVKGISGQLPNLQLILMGYHPQPEVLKRQIDEMGLRERVKYTGMLSYEEIPERLARCDTLLINRTADSFASYGFPIKLGEYFAAQRLVFCSEINGFTSELSDQVVKYKADDPAALGAMLLQRYTDHWNAEPMIKRAYEYAQQAFHIEKNGLIFTAALKSL